MPLHCKLLFVNSVDIQTVLNTLPQIDSKTVFYVHCTITLATDLEFYHHNLFRVPDYIAEKLTYQVLPMNCKLQCFMTLTLKANVLFNS